ncbi:MAG: SH3 domain-containing protein [Candidatus Aminicenantes bacterium]|nr:SH3 domain-containing protein [Candidatus Aminicenantes bacterium]
MRRTISLIFCLLFGIFVLGLNGAAGSTRIRITVERANIRLNPSLESPVIGTASAGMVFEIQGKIESWYRISLPPDEKGIVISGYIHSSIIEVLPEERKTEVEIKKETPPQPESQPAIPPFRAPSDKPSSSGGGVGFGVKLSGGMSYLIIGDLNSSFGGERKVVEENAVPSSVNGAIEDLHNGMDLGFSVFIYPVGRFGIELGAGFISAARKNEIEWEDAVFGPVEAIRTFEVSAIPLKLGICYDVPLGSKLALSLNAGGAYFLGRFKETSAYYNPGEDSDVKAEASKGCIGFYGGLDFTFHLSPGLSFFITAGGRYARLTKVEGDFSYAGLDWYEGPFSIEGKRTLYYYEAWGEYPRFVWRETGPAEFFEVGLREAVIDLSGIYFGAGIKLRFGRQ